MTDGTGATEFLKELVKNYLYLIHKVNGLEPVSLLPEDMTVQDQEVDSFLKYYSKDQKRPKKRKLHAFQIRKRKKDGNHLHVHESVVSVQAVLKRSRELGVSMTIFLTALFMMAINEEMSKMQKKKPVVLMVPVNLRKFFPSLSMLNFFNWIEPGYNFTTQDQSFEAILIYTKEFFETELTKEKMSAHISELLALELHPILRLAPLELKNLCIQAGAKYSEKNTTAIFSNMSAVKMHASYVPYIERFGVYTNTPKFELCLCSFQDKLSFAFTSRYDTVNIERNFYRLLKEQGIASEKVKPEFPKTDEPSEQEMKVYKIYSFLCIAIVAAMLVTECNFHPRIRWTLFTAGGFFCLGTNDLTQMTYGFSRDDAGKFLNAYYDAKIFENDPFAKLDQVGVGKLMKMAIELGKPVNPNLHVGICGEHGGDPSSVEFCHKIGLNYVSCSPFRVPIARLAAAQAAIAEKNA